MVSKLEDRVIDFGLNVLDTEPTHIIICSAEPTDPTNVSLGQANALANKAFSSGSVFGSPAAAGATGRSVASVTVTDGTVLTSGSAQWWAAYDSPNTRLLVHGALTNPQSVTATNTFTLGIFTVKIPNQ